MRVLLAILFAVGASAVDHCTARHEGYMGPLAAEGDHVDCCWTAAVEEVAASCSIDTDSTTFATSDLCVAEDVVGDLTCDGAGAADEDAGTNNQCKATWNAGNAASAGVVGPVPNVNCWNPWNLCTVAAASYPDTNADYDCVALGAAFFDVFVQFLTDDAACDADARRRLTTEEATDDDANDYDCYTEAFIPWVAACETYIVGLEEALTEEQRKAALTAVIGQTDTDIWYATGECSGAVESFQQWGWSKVSADDVEAVARAVKAANAEEEDPSDASSAAALSAAVGLVALLF